MNMKRWILASAALALSSPVMAQAPASSAAPSPAAQAAALELLNAMQYRKTSQQSIDNMLRSMRTGESLSRIVDSNAAIRMQRSKNPTAWDAALKKLGGRQADLAAPKLAELVPLGEANSARAYARNFSIEELKGLTEFYSSPLGRKLSSTVPAVSAESAGFMQAELGKRMASVLQTLQPEMQATLKPLLPTPANAPKK